MNTPREILLQRHQAIDSELVRIRRRVLTAEFAGAPRARPDLLAHLRLTLWGELFRPSQWVWAGLACA